MIEDDQSTGEPNTGAEMPPAPMLNYARPVPRYPVYWQSENIAALMPPTTSSESEKTIWGCGNQWQASTYFNGTANVTEPGWQSNNQASGWWIYSVSINRIKATLPNIGGSGAIGAGNGGVGAGDAGIGAGSAGGASRAIRRRCC